MKFKLNRAFRETSGELDGLVYRTVRGKVVASRKPDTSSIVYTENQVAHRQRFKQAALFGKAVMADNDVRAKYEEIAKERNIPLFATTIADFFNAPVIHSVDVLGYSGNVGDTILVTASDDTGVEKVHVSISAPDGSPIEHGEAVETSAGSSQWIYTATVQGQPVVKVQAVAVDRPGGTAVMNVDKTF